MKRYKSLILALCAILLCTASYAARSPKYVFYFIGDGMGVNVVQLAEMYQASLKGEVGIEPLVFSQFPVVSFGTTYSSDSDVTDSAASGTALATGVKTKNGCLGLGPAGERLESVAEKAHKRGVKVGIVTSVGINHATPAAFYAHQAERSMFYEISLDMIASGFEFFGGGNIERRNKLNDGTKVRDITEVMEDNGYTVVRGVEEYEARRAGADRIVMLPSPKKGLWYQIDRIQRDTAAMRLTDLTKAAIEYLDNRKGFFLMVEGGNIDGAEHGHDGATAIYDVLDFANSVSLAYEFYKQHPSETLIIVTADHETGGLALDPENATDLSVLQYQKCSQERLSSLLKKEMKSAGKSTLSWEETKAFLSEYTGLWDKVPVNWEQEKYLRDTYEETVAQHQAGHQKDLYTDNALLVARAVKVLNEIARVHWTTEHSAGMVPTYAIGVGAYRFAGKMDNTLIPGLISQIAKY